MSELGSGSGSSYPGSLDTDSTLEINSPNAGKTKARAEVPNDLAAAIIAVQTELGTDPAGTATNVKTFLQAEHATDGTHSDITVDTINTFPVSATPAANTVPVSDASSKIAFTSLVADNVNGLSFEATMSADQTVSTGSPSKILFDVETFDTNNNFATSTFTPTVAGKYLIAFDAYVYTDGSWNTTGYVSLYKNGSAIKRKYLTARIGAVASGIGGQTVIVDANGTTDTFELYVTPFATGTIKVYSLEAGIVLTYFSGCRVGI